jgi:hypothetical protein
MQQSTFVQVSELRAIKQRNRRNACTSIHPSICTYIHTCIHTYIHTYMQRTDIRSECVYVCSARPIHIRTQALCISTSSFLPPLREKKKKKKKKVMKSCERAERGKEVELSTPCPDSNSFSGWREYIIARHGAVYSRRNSSRHLRGVLVSS